MIILDETDDNADDNGMSKEYERVKRWREKHRGLANLRQRDYRKCKTASKAKQVDLPVQDEPGPKTNVIEGLRALITAESAKPVQIQPLVTPPARIFRSDNGTVITEEQWDELQMRKAKAKEAGFIIDEYAQ
jgi:hypothetical protein